MSLSVFLFGFILFGTLGFLDLEVSFPPQTREFSSHYFSNFSDPFSLFSFWDPCKVNVILLESPGDPLRYSHLFQFSSVAQPCPTLCDSMNRSMPGLPVHHQLPESTQTHVHRVGDAIQPSHPLSSPSPPAFNLSQHQSLFK